MHNSALFQREREKTRGEAKCNYNVLSEQLVMNTQWSKCHHNQLKVCVFFSVAGYREYL